jgi:Domain of unknown function (DUF4055)
MTAFDFLSHSPRPTGSEILEHDQTISDILAGSLRIKSSANSYIRKPEGMTAAAFNTYLRGAAFHNTAAATLATWLGLCERKPHSIELNGLDLPFKIDHHVLGVDQLITYALTNVLSYGRVAFYVDPAGSIWAYGPQDVVEIEFDNGNLSKATFQDSNGMLMTLFLEDGVAKYVWTKDDVEGAVGELVLEGKQISYLPVVFINAFDLSPHRSVGPLFQIAQLSLVNWDLALEQAHALRFCGSPQIILTGINNEAETPKSIGPSSIWALSNENAKAQMLSYTGEGIKDREALMLRNDMMMSSLGAQVVLNKGQSANVVAKTAEMKSRESAADLVQIIRNVSDGLTMVARFYAEQHGADVNKIRIQLNEDLIDLSLDANMVTALANLHVQGALSFQTLNECLRRGEVIPATATAERERELVDTDESYISTNRLESDHGKPAVN